MIALYLALYIYLIYYRPYRHIWVYRNPYSRRCEKCGRTENMFGELSVTGREITSWDQMYPLPDNTDAKCFKNG